MIVAMTQQQEPRTKLGDEIARLRGVLAAGENPQRPQVLELQFLSMLGGLAGECRSAANELESLAADPEGQAHGGDDLGALLHSPIHRVCARLTDRRRSAIYAARMAGRR